MSSAISRQQPKRAKPVRQKHVPQRTCIACQAKDAKRSYVRLVRTADLDVAVDRTGKQNGRGAYLCPSRACWYRALDTNAINRALRVELSEAKKAELREYARTHFPPDAEE
jgi:hypothetical protein